MPRKRSRRQDNKPSSKPYGFCCSPDNPPLKTKAAISLSIESLGSLHECPALRLREQVISKRPRQPRPKDGAKSPRSSSALKLSLQSLQEPGGLLLDKDATESALELMREILRGRRQMEYEQRMDRWAAIGERRVKSKETRLRKGGKPYWYTDFSIPQLQKLKELEDSLFKDKEEKTTSRTLNSLFAIGMMTEEVKIEPKEVSRLLNQFSADPIKFLYEVYRAINGDYFDNEDYRRDYSCSERIILSGIAFLELPRIVLTLHERLPPVVKLKLPPKPKPPQALRAKKMESPLLEKLHLPPNWRLYETELIDWRKKFFAIPRPVVILPKQVAGKEAANNKIGRDETIGEIESKKATISSKNSDKAKEKIPKEKSDQECVEETKTDDHRDTAEKIAGDTSENVDTEDGAEKIETREQEPSHAVAEENKQVAQPFPIQTDWTSPPTPCPYKYRKLLNQTGSLTTDQAFFAALNLPESPHKSFPSGRENLSLKLQHYLLDVEADFFKMTEETNRLTSEVGRIAQEIFEPERKCDACCACRQTRKTHLRWHATKTPHQVIDGVLTDESNKTQVIGALAMHSPAASVSSASEPPYVPSHDKHVKDLVIAGNATTIDSEIVRHVAGVTKTLEHVDREVLRPDVEIVGIRNVPPCGCADEEKELEMVNLGGGKDEGMCYGKKFRPKEGPAYSCGEFGRKDEAEGDCGCGEGELECVKEDDCGCGDETGVCISEDSQVELRIDVMDEIVEEQIGLPVDIKEGAEAVCRKCGMKSKTRCMDKFSEKLAKKGKGITGKICSCDSLSEFLQLDLTRTTCAKPERRYDKSERESRNIKLSSELRSSRKFSRNKISKPKDDVKVKKSVAAERKRKSSRKGITSDKETYGTTFKMPTKDAIREGTSIEKSSSDGGPYGYRTASEQALPIERTIAYLVDRHPPDYPAEEIPVRPGGRPCRCRENRNKRKTLLYGIGGLAKTMGRNADETNAEKVIEGVCWLTPEPSIRRSDEYIPEYELYDSPYEKQVCGGAGKAAAVAGAGTEKEEENSEENSTIVMNSQEDDRARDWENAFTDPYLTEFFTKTRESLPCWDKRTKLRKKTEEPRKLRVMKPVCECKYERRIVKRNEERQSWIDRQRKLKSMKKQSFLHIDGIAKVASISSEEENIDPNQTVVSAVTMQTPYNTPIHSRSISHLPYVPRVPSANVVATSVEAPPVAQEPMPERMDKSSNKKKSWKRRSSAKSRQLTGAAQLEKPSIYGADEANTDRQVASDEAGTTTVEPEIAKSSVRKEKTKRRMSFFDRLQGKLMIRMRRELDNMTNEGFVSLKLPDYHKIPQLSYWISYRVRGMCFTEKYKKELMENSIKIWNAKAHRAKNEIRAEYLKIAKKDRDKIDFNRARHWKRKIRRMKSQFYENLRQGTVNTGSELWRTMEFGKFPNLLFKQAYFTYLPAKEADAYVFRPWPR
ncbi:uncharacterized protein LOC103316198 isoform X1 [Nasonia vitripennis]|uniref:DUF4771 domain-containing protein n=2 Tax=Nasonia vitripennis TaxID=7425 RepID=A0A7M7H3U2_NASVI|nr:uncharacterized protein LOC103316198 isoform X1 [Nasonia vitripennis]